MIRLTVTTLLGPGSLNLVAGNSASSTSNITIDTTAGNDTGPTGLVQKIESLKSTKDALNKTEVTIQRPSSCTDPYRQNASLFTAPKKLPI